MDPAIDRIWNTKERIRKRSNILEKKLEQARRVLHLPGSEYYPLDNGPSSGEDSKVPFHLRTNAFRYTNMSSAQIRLAHDADRKNVKTKLALEDMCAQSTSQEEICSANDERKIFNNGSNFQTIKENLASLDLKILESKLETYKVKAGAICKQIAQRCSDTFSNTAGAEKSGIPTAVIFHDNNLSHSNNCANAREVNDHSPCLSSSGSIDKRDVAKKPRLYYNAKKNIHPATDQVEKLVAEESNDARVRRIRAGVSSADDSDSHSAEQSNHSQVSSKSLNTKLLEKPTSTHLSERGPVNPKPAVEENPPKLVLEKKLRIQHHLRKYETRKESSSSDEKECKLKSRQRNDKDLAYYINRKRMEKRDRLVKKEGPRKENIEKVKYYDQNLIRKLIEQRKLYLSKEKLLSKKLKEQEKLILQENIRNILDVQRERRRQPFIELYLNAKKARINVYDSINGLSSNEHFVEELKKRYESEGQDDAQQLPNKNSRDVIQKLDPLQSSISGRLLETTGRIPVPKLDFTSLFEDSPPSINQEFDHFQSSEQAIEKPNGNLPRAIASSTTSSSDSIVQKRISHRQQDISSNKSSPGTPNPPPSVSSLSLITPPDNRTISIDYNGRFSCEKIPYVTSVNGNSSFSSQKDFTPKALQVQVNAGLNYLNFIHNSIDQVKDIEFAANAMGNSTNLNEQTTSHKKVEYEKSVFVEHSLLAQMTETQKLLCETIRSTNEHLENSRLLFRSENIVEIAAKTAEVVTSSFLKAQTPGLSTPSKRRQRSSSSSSSEIFTVSSEHQPKKSKERPSKLPSKIPAASIVVNSGKANEAARSKKFFKSYGTSQKSGVRVRSVSVRHQKNDSSFVNDGSSSSFSITDRTERESKLRALRSSLKEKKQLADKLKQEYKRRTNEKFRLTEESLKKQVQIYDEHIREIKTQIDAVEKEPSSNSSAWKPPTSPRIMSPRIGSTPQSCRLNNESGTERTLTPRSLFSEKSRSKSPIPISSKSTVNEGANNQSEKKTSMDPSVADKNSNSAPTTNIFSSTSSSKSKFPSIDSTQKSSSKSLQIFDENDLMHVETAEIETTDEVSDVPEEETINDERSSSDHTSKTIQIESNHTDLTIKLNGSSLRTFEESPPSKEELQIKKLELVEDKFLSSNFPFKNEALLEELVDTLFATFLRDELRSILIFYKNDRVKIPSKHSGKNRVDELCASIFKNYLWDSLKDCLKVVADISSIKQLVERNISPSASPRSPSVTKYVSEIYRFPDNDRSQQPVKSPRSLMLPKLDFDQVDSITESILHLEQDDFIVDSLEECSATKPVFNLRPLGDATLKQTTPLALTTDVFAAIPLGRNQHEILVNAILDQLYENRRCGESISDAVALQTYYNIPLENASLSTESNRSSQKVFVLNSDADIAYRDFIFDYCKEILTQIFSDDISNSDYISSVYRQCTASFEIEISENDFLKLATVLGKPIKFKMPGQYSKLKYQKNGRDSRNVARIICDNFCGFERGIQNVSLIHTKSQDANSRHKSVARKKLDVVDEILLPEMYTEEFSWTDYEFDELCCEIRIFEQIWGNLIEEEFNTCFNTLSTTSGIVI